MDKEIEFDEPDAKQSMNKHDIALSNWEKILNQETQASNNNTTIIDKLKQIFKSIFVSKYKLEENEDQKIELQGQIKRKKMNSVIQQIDQLTKTTMDDRMARQAIQNHKQFLELVQHRAAIAYFCAINKNLSLYNALKEHFNEQEDFSESDFSKSSQSSISCKKSPLTIKSEKQNKKVRIQSLKSYQESDSNEEKSEDEFLQQKISCQGLTKECFRYLKQCFRNMINEYDFFSIIIYPDLKARKQFVHDAWEIAKFTENFELKMIIIQDPNFFLTREDIFQLVHTEDNEMIEEILKNDIMLEIQDDISYRLVSIKNSKVDQKLHTTIKLVDFLSVIIQNRKIQIINGDFAFKQVLFDHEYIVKFLERHKYALDLESTIKIFILEKKFKLAIKYLMMIQKDDFTIDYFTLAIRSGAFYLGFYLYQKYENEIIQEHSKSVGALLDIYRNSNKHLKAKLYMTYILLPIFSFGEAKTFLQIVQKQISDLNFETNLFCHSSNPILAMCLLYELFNLLSRKFFSLNQMCRTFNKKVMNIAILYINSVDDENCMTSYVLEKDYINRDALKIAVQYELLDLIQHPKIQSIILKILNSDYDTSGSILQMSTSYQILMQSHEQIIDIELQNRFYKKRNIEEDLQSQWIFLIYQKSMFSRIMAEGFMTSLISLIIFIFYTIGIQYFQGDIGAIQKELLQFEYQAIQNHFDDIQFAPMHLSNQEMENFYITQKKAIEHSKKIDSLFEGVTILNFLNSLYLIQHIIQMIFVIKLGRSFQFPTLEQFIDSAIFACSIYSNYVYYYTFSNPIPEREDHPFSVQEDSILQKFQENLIFQVMFSIIVSCLLFRVLLAIQFNQIIGPLIKIVQKMADEFINFLIFYLILALMFVLIGTQMFMFDCQDYSTIFNSFITVTNAAMGNFFFSDFDQIDDNVNLQVFGKIYVVVTVITFLIVVLNLLIGVLTNVFNNYEDLGTGLFLSKILSTRDQLESDEYYGAFISALVPFNIFIIPFIPFGIFMNKSDNLICLNKFLNYTQYMGLMTIFFIGFIGTSIILLPFAYLRAIYFKIRLIYNKNEYSTRIIIQEIFSLLLFVFFGIVMLSFTLIADCYYFWKNNFRSSLKKIVVENERSLISLDSFKKMISFCQVYKEKKLSAVFSDKFIKSYREEIHVDKMVQFLIFGQMIDNDEEIYNNGKKSGQIRDDLLKYYVPKSRISQLKQSLKIKQNDFKNGNLAILSNSLYHQTVDQLRQYNEVKKILNYLSFEYKKHKKVLNCSIISDLSCELKRERKMIMSLKDTNIVNFYASLNLKKYQYLLENNEDDQIPQNIKEILKERTKQRNIMLEKFSMVRINYIYKCLKSMNLDQEVVIIDPLTILDKQKTRKEREVAAKKQAEIFSYKTQLYKKLTTQNSASLNPKSKYSVDESDFTQAFDPTFNQDPMIKALKNVFSKLKSEIDKTGNNYSQQATLRVHNQSSTVKSGKLIVFFCIFFIDYVSK